MSEKTKISLTRLQFYNLMSNVLFVYGEEQDVDLDDMMSYLKVSAEMMKKE